VLLEIAPRIIPAADVLPVCAVLTNLATFLQTRFLALKVRFEEIGLLMEKFSND
jgi:hypothetical protein